MKSRTRFALVLAGSLSGTLAGSPCRAQEILIDWANEIVTPDTVPPCPQYPHQGDGSWPVLPAAEPNKLLVFWGNQQSHRMKLDPSSKWYDWVQWPLTDGVPGAGGPYYVMNEGARGHWDASHQVWTYGDFDNGGTWLYNVTRYNGVLYGFYHAEDHDWPGASDAPDDLSWNAWASAALATSTDDGITWTKLGQVVCTDKLHPPPGPAPSIWGGNGGNTTRFDEVHQRWVMMFHSFSWGNIRMAATLDANPLGPWFKYHDGSFSEPGVTGTVVNGQGVGGGESLLDGIKDIAGATQPSLHFNTYLNKWVVMFRSGGDLYFSTTADVFDPHWSKPKVFLSWDEDRTLIYPNVIGDTPQHGISSHFAGQNATLVVTRHWTNEPADKRRAVRVPITFNMNPDADFSASVTATPVKRPVQFTDLSTNEPTSWAWTFGDGGTSTLQNPSHTYMVAGTYTVTLTASNSFLPGGNVETKTGYVTVSVPEADFHAQIKSGSAPLTVAFMDRSTASPTSWTWNFGDGTPTGGQPHPTHTFSNPGTYDVTLTATNGWGSQTITKKAYITVGAQAAPVADFTAYPRKGGIGMKAQFTDTSSNAPSSWSWTFGDGDTSTERNPVHQYANAGTYTVTLTATNAHGNDAETKTGHVVVRATPFTEPLSSSVDSYVESTNGNGNGNWWYYEWNGSQYIPMTFNPSRVLSCLAPPVTVAWWEGTGTDGCWFNNIVSWGQTSTQNQSARGYLVQHAGELRIKTRAGNGIGRLNSKGGDGVKAVICVTSSPTDIGHTLWEKYYPYDSNVLDDLDFTAVVKENDLVFIRGEAGATFGSDSLSVQFEMTETWGGAPPTADFSANVTTGNAPLDVTFTSTVSADVFEYAWDFDGDGTVDSTEANPTFRFKYAGPHDVTLKVYGKFGMDVMKKPAFVRPTGTVAYHSIAADDGFVVESAAGSGVGQDVYATITGMWGLTTGDDVQNRRIKAFTSFDTSWIPDNAVIDSTTLSVEYDDASVVGFPYGLKPLKVDAQTGTFNAQALEAADFQATATATAVASENFKVQQYPPTNVILLGFNASGVAAVNKTGLTQCRIWWNDGTDNMADNDWLGFFPGGGVASQASKRAKLLVKFH